MLKSMWCLVSMKSVDAPIFKSTLPNTLGDFSAIKLVQIAPFDQNRNSLTPTLTNTTKKN